MEMGGRGKCGGVPSLGCSAMVEMAMEALRMEGKPGNGLGASRGCCWRETASGFMLRRPRRRTMDNRGARGGDRGAADTHEARRREGLPWMLTQRGVLAR